MLNFARLTNPNYGIKSVAGSRIGENEGQVAAIDLVTEDLMLT